MVSASESLMTLVLSLSVLLFPLWFKTVLEKNRAMIMFEFDLSRLSVYLAGAGQHPHRILIFLFNKQTNPSWSTTPLTSVAWHSISGCFPLRLAFSPVQKSFQRIFKQNKVSLNMSHSGRLSNLDRNDFSECVVWYAKGVCLFSVQGMGLLKLRWNKPVLWVERV